VLTDPAPERRDSLVDDDGEADDDVPRGRHSRGAPVVTEPPPSGRHATGGRSAERQAGSRTPAPSGRAAARTSGRRARPASGDLAVVDLPEDATPEEVAAAADRMLDQLAVTTPRPRLLDPDDLPGGKWGMAAAGTLAVLVVMLVIWTMLGAVFGH